MNNLFIKLPITLISIILISNLLSGYINAFTEGIIVPYHYQTKNAEYEFTLVPTKGIGVQMMEKSFIDFKKTNPQLAHLALYRTFELNPLKFWNWYRYLADDMYQYEYLPRTLKDKSL